MRGRTVDDYQAPLFLAWQLTNRCSARCIACCEESGPDKAWDDELRRDEALDLARRIADWTSASESMAPIQFHDTAGNRIRREDRKTAAREADLRRSASAGARGAGGSPAMPIEGAN